MKHIIIYLLTSFLIVGCTNQNSDLSTVETFIESLKEGDNQSTFEKPDFSSGDIEELLEYRNDETIVTNFPRNPLSSFYMEEVSIGMYVLWTIEGIRMDEIEDPDFYLFASLNPRVYQISTDEIPDQLSVLPEIATIYNNWWNSTLEISEKLEIHPLENEDYIWN